jgi:hypothetical protein
MNAGNNRRPSGTGITRAGFAPVRGQAYSYCALELRSCTHHLWVYTTT